MNSYVFVIGAGASKELGMPLGYELKAQIAKSLRILPMPNGKIEGSLDIRAALERLILQTDFTMDDFDGATRAIADAMPTAESIDNYVHQHRDHPVIAMCAKLAIADCIIKKEAGSKLKPYEFRGSRHLKINLDRLEGTWLLPFFMLITKGAKVDELPKRFGNITLVVFNYDRCVEHFLHSTLVSHYRIRGEQATEIMQNLTILHPYGHVGNLPWMGGDIERIAFGQAPNTSELIAVSQRIRTFTESVERHDKNTTVLRIRSAMAKADRLVFLGFAYDDLNMELLTPSPEKSTGRSAMTPHRTYVHGTAHGISEEDKKEVMRAVSRCFRTENVNLLGDDKTCKDLFGQLSRALKIRE